MRFLPYVLKHLRRNWLRTLSTVFGMALCIFLICTLQTVLQAMRDNIDGASPARLATRHAVSLVFNMPFAYKARIAAVPGVRRVSPSAFFGGLLGSGGSAAFADFFVNFAVESERYFAMSPEYAVSPDQF